MADKRPSKPPPRPPVPTPRPKPRPPIDRQPGDMLRERRRLSAPDNEQEMSMKKMNKGLGFAVNKRPVDSGAKPMPYTPREGGGAKTMPLKPGQGAGAKTMPYRPNKPALDPVRRMSYDAPVMDSLGDPMPPGYADTMEYIPERDGDAWGQGGPYQGEDPGIVPLGKQEENQKWKYDNWRSEEGRPIPEDGANVYNDLFDEWDRKRPVTGADENPTEVAQWERSVRRAAAEAGLSEEEIEQLLNDLYDLD